VDRIEQFCSFYHEYNAISEQRRSMQRRVLREAQSRIGKDLVDFERRDLAAYLETLVRQDEFKPRTVAARLYALRPFFEWAWREKLISAERLMELKDVEPPRGSTVDAQPNPYSRKQIAYFWREVEKKYPLPEDSEKWVSRWERGISPWKRAQPVAKRYQLEAIVALALCGGLRRDEIWRIGLEDMSPDNEYIVVHGARKNAEGVSYVRVVPWTTEWMREAVERWLTLRERIGPEHDQPWLSLHYSWFKHPLSFEAYELLVRRIPPGWSYQRFRHTAATELLRAGYELQEVQAIMGHSRIQQTLGYAKIIPDDLVKTARRANANLSRAITPVAA
jgi:site-specific recombinase XerD